MNDRVEYFKIRVCFAKGKLLKILALKSTVRQIYVISLHLAFIVIVVFAFELLTLTTNFLLFKSS